MSRLAGRNSIHNYDFICISETYLDSLIPLYGRNFKLNDYGMIRVDRPRYVKRGNVCTFFNESLYIRKLNFLFIIKYQCLTKKDLLPLFINLEVKAIFEFDNLILKKF